MTWVAKYMKDNKKALLTMLKIKGRKKYTNGAVLNDKIKVCDPTHILA